MPDAKASVAKVPLLKAKLGVVATIFKTLEDEECLIDDADGTTKASEAAAATRAMIVEGSFMVYCGFALWLWEELTMMKVKNYESVQCSADWLIFLLLQRDSSPTHISNGRVAPTRSFLMSHSVGVIILITTSIDVLPSLLRGFSELERGTTFTS